MTVGNRAVRTMGGSPARLPHAPQTQQDERAEQRAEKFEWAHRLGLALESAGGAHSSLKSCLALLLKALGELRAALQQRLALWEIVSLGEFAGLIVKFEVAQRLQNRLALLGELLNERHLAELRLEVAPPRRGDPSGAAGG